MCVIGWLRIPIRFFHRAPRVAAAFPGCPVLVRHFPAGHSGRAVSPDCAVSGTDDGGNTGQRSWAPVHLQFTVVAAFGDPTDWL